MQSAKLHFFIKHFLILPILYEGTSLINFDFVMKEDFWYVVSILNFTGLNVCNPWFLNQVLVQSKKCRKVNALTSIFNIWKLCGICKRYGLRGGGFVGKKLLSRLQILFFSKKKSLF